MKNKIKIIFLLLMILLFTIILIVNFSKIKKDNTYKNSYYSSNIKKINDSDFSIDKIKLGLSMQEIQDMLGEPIEVSEFVDSEESDSSYKRFDYEDLIIQFDYDKETVNYIASSKIGLKNYRGIASGDTVTSVLKTYYGEENIEVCENSYGSYDILYGKDDAMKYIDELDSQDKTFAYIYKYDNEINSIIFCENGKILEFYFTDNIVNMIIVSESYKPW